MSRSAYSSASPISPLQRGVEALVVFFATIVFVFITRPAEQSGNAVAYISAIRNYDWNHFLAPHLIHLPTMNLIYRLGGGDGSCDVTCAGMAQSVFWAGVAIAAVWTLGRWLFSVAGAAALSLGVLLSSGFWIFTGQAEVYVPAVGAALAASSLLLTGTSDDKSWGRLAAVAVFWAIATMYHFVDVFLFVPIFVYLVFVLGGRGLVRWIFTSAVAGGIVVAFFIAGYIASVPSPSVGGFLVWQFEIANRPLTDWGTVSNFTPADMVRAVWNQIEAFAVWPPVLSGGLAYPWSQLPLALLIAAVLAIAVVWNIVAVLRKRVLAAERLYFLVLGAVWFLTFTWWDPSVHKFYIHSAVALTFLIAFVVHDVATSARSPSVRQGAMAAAAAAVVLVAILNAFSVRELARSTGPMVAEAKRLTELSPPDCVVYTIGQHQAPMKLHFDWSRTVFAVYLEREFYLVSNGQMERKPDRFASDTCSFMMIGWLSPQRFDSTVIPYMPSARWEDFVAFVLDAQPTDDGRLSINPIEIVPGEKDAGYVVIDRTRRTEIAGIEEITDQLKAAFDQYKSQFAGRIDGLSERSTASLLSMPYTGFATPYDRSRFFGYSWGDDVRQLVNGQGNAG